MKITPYNVAMVGQGPIWVLFTAAFCLSLTAHPLISPMASCLHTHNQTTNYNIGGRGTVSVVCHSQAPAPLPSGGSHF